MSAVTFLAGAGSAAVGLYYVLTGGASVVDMILLMGGLLVVLAGLVIRGRSPKT